MQALRCCGCCCCWISKPVASPFAGRCHPPLSLLFSCKVMLCDAATALRCTENVVQQQKCRKEQQQAPPKASTVTCVLSWSMLIQYLCDAASQVVVAREQLP